MTGRPAAPRVRLAALTVRQPYAWAISCGGKDVENRGRRTHYRGPVAVHAGLTVDTPILPTPTPAAAQAAQQHLTAAGAAEFWNAREQPAGGPPRSPGLACGAFTSLTRIVGCHPQADPAKPCDFGRAPMCSPWGQRRQWHWELADTLTLPVAVPAVGARGLWTVTPEQLAALWELEDAAEWLRWCRVADPRH